MLYLRSVPRVCSHTSAALAWTLSRLRKFWSQTVSILIFDSLLQCGVAILGLFPLYKLQNQVAYVHKATSSSLIFHCICTSSYKESLCCQYWVFCPWAWNISPVAEFFWFFLDFCDFTNTDLVHHLLELYQSSSFWGMLIQMSGCVGVCTHICTCIEVRHQCYMSFSSSYHFIFWDRYFH